MAYEHLRVIFNDQKSTIRFRSLTSDDSLNLIFTNVSVK